MFSTAIATASYSKLLRRQAILLIAITASCVDAAGVDDGQCVLLAESSPSYETIIKSSGEEVGYLPYTICKELCPGWTHFPLRFIAFLVIQFILPTIIFAIVIPRRWHLDLPPTLFKLGHGGLFTLPRLFFISILMVLVACADLILWASMIMAFSGPMIFSVLHELYLDSRVLSLLGASALPPGNIALTASERLDLLVILVCGQFSGSPWNTTARIRAAFSASPGNANALALSKTRLKCAITSQAPFGAAVGITTLFYLGGILYTANGILQLTVHGDDAIPYALWLLTIVSVAIVASTPITGNAPAVVNILTNLPGHTPKFTWLPCLVDYYLGELYPTAMWDRGDNKLSWLLESQAHQNHGAPFAQKVRLSIPAWTGLFTAAIFLSIVPSLMAFELAYNIPFPREGCRTLSYATYIACQIWLVTITSLTSLKWDHFPVPKAGRKYHKPWQRSLRVGCYCVAVLASGVAGILAFLVSFLGTIFQIFGVYNNCLCQTPVSTWIRPAAQRLTFIDFASTEARNIQIATFTSGITWAAAGVTLGMCLLSWWYQKVTSATTMEEIDAL